MENTEKEIDSDTLLSDFEDNELTKSNNKLQTVKKMTTKFRKTHTLKSCVREMFGEKKVQIESDFLVYQNGLKIKFHFLYKACNSLQECPCQGL